MPRRLRACITSLTFLPLVALLCLTHAWSAQKQVLDAALLDQQVRNWLPAQREALHSKRCSVSWISTRARTR